MNNIFQQDHLAACLLLRAEGNHEIQKGVQKSNIHHHNGEHLVPHRINPLPQQHHFTREKRQPQHSERQQDREADVGGLEGVILLLGDYQIGTDQTVVALRHDVQVQIGRSEEQNCGDDLARGKQQAVVLHDFNQHGEDHEHCGEEPGARYDDDDLLGGQDLVLERVDGCSEHGAEQHLQ